MSDCGDDMVTDDTPGLTPDLPGYHDAERYHRLLQAEKAKTARLEKRLARVQQLSDTSTAWAVSAAALEQALR